MEEDEVEENEHFEDGPYGKQGEMNTPKEDEERLPSPGPSPSPSSSIPDYQDSNFGSETGCEPAEFDDEEEPDVICSAKVAKIDEFDLSTFDLGRLVVDCDITDQLAGLLEAWI